MSGVITEPFLLFVCSQIEDISGRKNVRMLYVDDEGDRVCLDNSGEANASCARCVLFGLRR